MIFSTCDSNRKKGMQLDFNIKKNKKIGNLGGLAEKKHSSYGHCMGSKLHHVKPDSSHSSRENS